MFSTELLHSCNLGAATTTCACKACARKVPAAQALPLNTNKRGPGLQSQSLSISVTHLGPSAIRPTSPHAQPVAVPQCSTGEHGMCAYCASSNALGAA
jgi:hypothetical protein